MQLYTNRHFRMRDGYRALAYSHDDAEIRVGHTMGRTLASKAHVVSLRRRMRHTSTTRARPSSSPTITENMASQSKGAKTAFALPFMPSSSRASANSEPSCATVLMDRRTKAAAGKITVALLHNGGNRGICKSHACDARSYGLCFCSERMPRDD
uniref:Uncharacterized protein n=1 Tax=Steinernema glaseri TaxID=37863 RepID=A0A1I7ZY93_9BILA